MFINKIAAIRKNIKFAQKQKDSKKIIFGTKFVYY